MQSVNIDFGCGNKKKRGYVGVDSVAVLGVDKVMDLNKKLKFEDGKIDKISRYFCYRIYNAQ